MGVRLATLTSNASAQGLRCGAAAERRRDHVTIIGLRDDAKGHGVVNTQSRPVTSVTHRAHGMTNPGRFTTLTGVPAAVV
jgi:hypothetical protein